MITVLVIAESADNCIKTVIWSMYYIIVTVISFSFYLFSILCLSVFQMLRNCKVARSLSRIADCAKNDRSAILRARFALPFLRHTQSCVAISVTIIFFFFIKSLLQML